MDPLLITKIAIPPVRQRRVERPRLMAQLESGLERHLVLVSAPAGFGKTTLVASWAERAAWPVAWLSLDEEDNDPVRFLSYLFAALQHVDVTLDTRPPLTLEPGQSTQQERAVIALINEVGSRPGEFALVLDDYHFVTAAEVHGLVTYLLDHLPSNLHMIICTRADPPLPLARLRGRGQLVELRAVDLRFSLEEVSGFLGETMGLNVGPEDAARLTHRTEGWAAGLQMAAVSLTGRDDVSGIISAFAGSHRYVMDYLIEEVWERQPAHIQAFLLRTSILDLMSASLCDVVVGGEIDAQSILESLERANLFIVCLDDQREWFRYHRLFADLLRQRLGRLYAAMLPELHSRAAGWYQAHGFVSEAISHALAAERFGLAADMIADAAEATLLRSEIRTFVGWMEALPEVEICQRPALCVYYAWPLFWSGRPTEEIERWLAQLGESEKEQSGQVAALRALVALYRGARSEVTAQSRMALDHLAPGDSLFRGIASLLDASALWDGGDFSLAVGILGDVSRQYAASGNVMAAMMTLSILGEQYLRASRLSEAEQVFRRAVELADDGRGGLLPAAGQPLMGMGMLAYMHNDLAEARDLLLQGIEVSRGAGEIVSLDGLITLSRVQDAEGDVAGAAETLDEALRVAVQFDATDIDDLAVELSRARFWIMHGNLQAARVWAGEHGLLGAARPQDQSEVAIRMRKYGLAVVGRLYLAEARYQEALDALDEAQAPLEARGRTLALLELLALKALALTRLGDRDQADKAMDRALLLAAPESCIRVLADVGGDLALLLRRAASRGVVPAFVAEVLAAIPGQAPTDDGPRMDLRSTTERHKQTPATDVQQLVEPLTERELEVLRLLPTHLSSIEIAQYLYVATSTARSHIKSIYSKLGVHSRDGAVLRAQELGLL